MRILRRVKVGNRYADIDEVMSRMESYTPPELLGGLKETLTKRSKYWASLPLTRLPHRLRPLVLPELCEAWKTATRVVFPEKAPMLFAEALAEDPAWELHPSIFARQLYHHVNRGLFTIEDLRKLDSHLADMIQSVEQERERSLRRLPMFNTPAQRDELIGLAAQYAPDP